MVILVFLWFALTLARYLNVLSNSNETGTKSPDDQDSQSRSYHVSFGHDDDPHGIVKLDKGTELVDRFSLRDHRFELSSLRNTPIVGKFRVLKSVH